MTKEKVVKHKKSAILVTLLLLLVVTVVGYTYSRYISRGSANSTAKIAQWSVKIGANDLDTYTTNPLTATLIWEENEYVANDVIAPGRAGTYEVKIDPSGSQVAIDYSIKVSEISGLTVANDKIKVTSAKYWIGEVTGNGLDANVTGEDNITINETLADVLANKKLTVKVTIEWENDDNNNEADTASGKAAETATVKTTITAQQHLATD